MYITCGFNRVTKVTIVFGKVCLEGSKYWNTRGLHKVGGQTYEQSYNMKQKRKEM